MIALWMVYATLVGLALAAGASLAERAAATLGISRRWTWAAGFVLSTLLPAYAALRPEPAQGAVVAAAAHLSPNPASPEPAPTGQATAWLREIAGRAADATRTPLERAESVLVGGWIASATLLLGLYAAAAWSLRRSRRRWRSARVADAEVLVAPDTGPAVVGAARPAIVLPEWALGLSAEQQHLMLAHEREHVRARDPLLLHTAAALVALMPWNLGAWWMLRRLRLAVEIDCDGRVLRAGCDAGAYGALLLDVGARRSGVRPLMAPALIERRTSLSRRITAMLPRSVRFRRTQAAVCTSLAVAALAVACEAPTPEVLAPDGRDGATARHYGSGQPGPQPTDSTSALVAAHFPEVIRGVGEPSILYLLTDAEGRVVRTHREKAAGVLLRTKRSDGESLPQGESGEYKVTLRGDRIDVTGDTIRATSGGTFTLRSRSDAPPTTLRARQAPDALADIDPASISSVDVTKHAAGKLGPDAVSVIRVTLKPGVTVPASGGR